MVLHRLLPYHPRIHPLVYLWEERRFWPSEDLIESDQEELDKGLAWLELISPLIPKDSLLCTLKQDWEGGENGLETLCTLAAQPGWQKRYTEFVDPLAVLESWKEKELQKTPEQELIQLVAEEMEHWPLLDSELETVELFRTDWSSHIQEISILARAYHVRTSSDIRCHYQERPSPIPLVGSLLWEETVEPDFALSLVQLLEDQFRHGVDQRLSLGCELEREQSVLDTFELLEECCENYSEAELREAEGKWADWLTGLRLTKPKWPGFENTDEVRRRRGKEAWSCPLCGQANLPGDARCTRCFLGVL